MDLNRLKIDRGPESSTPPRAAATASRGRGRPWPIGKLVALGVVVACGVLFKAPILDGIDRMRLPKVATGEVVRRSPAAAGTIAGASANGYIIARVKAALSADTPGRIVELNVVEGQKVSKGFVVARLYDEEYKAALAAAEGDLEVAQEASRREVATLVRTKAERDRLESVKNAATASIAEAEADDVLWTLEVKRMQDLVKDGAENVKLLEQAEASLKSAKSRVESAKAREAAAVADLAQGAAAIGVQESAAKQAVELLKVKAAARDEAKARLDKTVIRAPFDGIVVLKDAEVGEVVSPNVQAGGNARGSVATMVDFASLEVQAEVPEASIGLVELNAPSTFFLDAYPSKPYAAIVDRIWPTANKQKGTIEVRAKITTPDERLRPEMQCRIVFGAQAKTDVGATTSPDLIMAPQDSVVRVGGKTFVFVLERDVAVERAVDLGEKISDLIVVKSGVTEGDVVLRSPPPTLRSGDRVLPLSPASNSSK